MMARIKPENIQTIIDEYFCLPYKGLDGQTSKCTQCGFIGDDTMMQLSKEVRGKLHIKVHASSMLKEK